MSTIELGQPTDYTIGTHNPIGVPSQAEYPELILPDSPALQYYNPTDHGRLSGLSDDDHTQYLNLTRGDARYLSKTNTSSYTPSADYHPATKKYVDANIGVGANYYLSAVTVNSISNVDFTMTGTTDITGIDFSSAFVDLTDAPDTVYTGHGDKFLRVNATANGLSWVSASSIDLTDFNDDLTGSVSGGTSLTGGGVVTGTQTITLVNDSSSPGNEYYYGTNASGTKGWYVLPAAGGGATALTGLSDTPANYDAAANHILQVNDVGGDAGDAVIFTGMESISLSSFNDDLTHTDTNAIHDNETGEISAITAKGAPLSTNDNFIIEEVSSNAKRRVLFSTIQNSISFVNQADTPDSYASSTAGGGDLVTVNGDRDGMIWVARSSIALSEFNDDLGYASYDAGAGIDILSNTISIDLAPSSGLELTGTGNSAVLQVNAGDSIDISDGTVAVQAQTGGGITVTPIGLTVDYAGSGGNYGSAASVARSDHDHNYDDYDYWTFQTSYDTNSNNVSSGETVIFTGTNGIQITHPAPNGSPYSIEISGENVTGTPYSAGTALTLSNYTFSVKLPQLGSGLYTDGNNYLKIQLDEGGDGSGLAIDSDSVGLSINRNYIDLGTGKLVTTGDDTLTFATVGNTTINLASGTYSVLSSPLGGDLSLGSYAIKLNGLPTTSPFGSGFIIEEDVEGTVSIGELVYYDSGTDLWDYAQGDSTTTDRMPALGITLEAGAGNGNPTKILLYGYMRLASWTWTPEDILYVSDSTNGVPTNTAPSGSGDKIQVIGIAKTSTTIFFNPSLNMITHV